MTRKLTKSESDAIKAQVLAMLSVEPLTGQEIAHRMDVNGRSLGNMFTTLLREGKISRFQWRKGQYRYFIGNTAPAGKYTPAPKREKPKPVARVPAMPVKRVVVRPFSIAGDDGKAFSVTLPAAPWEVAA